MAAIVNKVYTQDKLETMVIHLFGGGWGWDGQTMYVMAIAKVVNNIRQENKQTNKQESNTETTKTNKKLRQVGPPRLDLLNPSFPRCFLTKLSFPKITFKCKQHQY